MTSVLMIQLHDCVNPTAFRMKLEGAVILKGISPTTHAYLPSSRGVGEWQWLQMAEFAYLGDEIHFLLDCPNYSSSRESLIKLINDECMNLLRWIVLPNTSGY